MFVIHFKFDFITASYEPIQEQNENKCMLYLFFYFLLAVKRITNVSMIEMY